MLTEPGSWTDQTPLQAPRDEPLHHQRMQANSRPNLSRLDLLGLLAKPAANRDERETTLGATAIEAGDQAQLSKTAWRRTEPRDRRDSVKPPTRPSLATTAALPDRLDRWPGQQ